MWSFKNKKIIPNFGFQVEVVQKHDNGNIVYAGYGFRVVEINTKSCERVYQLRVKDNNLLDWGLLGTFNKTSELRRKLRELPTVLQEMSFAY